MEVTKLFDGSFFESVTNELVRGAEQLEQSASEVLDDLSVQVFGATLSTATASTSYRGESLKEDESKEWMAQQADGAVQSLEGRVDELQKQRRRLQTDNKRLLIETDQLELALTESECLLNQCMGEDVVVFTVAEMEAILLRVIAATRMESPRGPSDDDATISRADEKLVVDAIRSVLKDSAGTLEVAHEEGATEEPLTGKAAILAALEAKPTPQPAAPPTEEPPLGSKPELNFSPEMSIRKDKQLMLATLHS